MDWPRRPQLQPGGPHIISQSSRATRRPSRPSPPQRRGAVSLNGAEQSASKLQPFGTTGAGDRIQLEINMADKEMKMSILKGGMSCAASTSRGSRRR